MRWLRELGQALGSRLVRLGLRLMGVPPDQFAGFHHPDFADPDALARFAAAAWWLDEAPLHTVPILPRETGDRTTVLVEARQAALRAARTEGDG